MRHLFFASLTFQFFLTPTAQAEYRLTILHTNDFHSQFSPMDQFDNLCSPQADAEGKCFAGSARLATAIAEARARTKNTVLLDAGDQFPSRTDANLARPELLAELMNRMGYDAIALGSHEFDQGPEVAREFIDALGFPALIANADLSAEPLLDDMTRKSMVIEHAAERLGIIGLTPECADCWAGVDYISIFDPVGAVKEEAARLTADGIDKIIVLSHAGFYVDQKIAREAEGVDVIVGGHSHTYLSNTLKPSQGPYPTIENGVPIVHAWPYGNTLGELNLIFDETGSVVSAVGDQIRLDGDVAMDKGIQFLLTGSK
ncbi:metallophosphoesterase [Aestuariicoccus sp. MJ-SS9]|uniref:metallophosphoesterase n=1 Tax=Aestuariicoccus sp. MJ-SS9 TaxID=3079855 RepID=UPI002913E69D|nr:metallophosphoesterase [Aestuariicoccus sp. MJ-SS9]MDU8914132.1 metallophosphoesterase [Aestuariicoccus sp. MJ-SS9]